jgi:NADH-quinone oxidoreductase subunit E
MARLSAANTERARELMGHYPRSRSALIPMCHLAQEQDGYLTEDAMEHIAELLDITPAEVYGTASFYEMFKFHPVGKYFIGVCTNISCMLVGGEELLEHCERTLGVHNGGTTADGLFTLEEMECLASCTNAPCLQVNYRYFDNVTNADADALITDLRAGKRADEVPPHGTLGRTRQHIPAERRASHQTI